ncbi:MAG TPA: flagellar hook-basal body complex protein FliE [Terracidiphilus sp.]|nr:flagellar hook-basal body complex protein FliE [Terracidiphilus sp.]
MQTAMSAMTAMTAAASSATSVNGAAGAFSGALNSGAASSGPAPTPFASLLTDAVGQVNSLEGQARSAVDGLMQGTGVDVHQAMIATQKADMAFELALAVRNKAVQAYQQVMGLQF